MSKFIIVPTKTGFTFHLTAQNGQTIVTSELYSRIISCKKGIASVVKNAPIASISDLTSKEPAITTCPKYEMYLDKKNEYRFRLRAKNAQIIAVSQGYSSKNSCIKGIESTKSNAPIAEIIIENKEKK